MSSSSELPWLEGSLILVCCGQAALERKILWVQVFPDPRQNQEKKNSRQPSHASWDRLSCREAKTVLSPHVHQDKDWGGGSLGCSVLLALYMGGAQREPLSMCLVRGLGYSSPHYPGDHGHGDRYALCLSRGCAAPCNYTFFKLGRMGLLEKPHWL